MADTHFRLKNLLFYLGMGILVDTCLVLLFTFCDIVDILNRSSKNIQDIPFQMVTAILPLYMVIFVLPGIILSLLLYLMLVFKNNKNKAWNFIIAKMDILVVIWVALLYSRFFAFHLKKRFSMPMARYTDEVLVFCIVLVALSILSLFLSRKPVRILLYASRALMALLVLFTVFSLIAMNMSFELETHGSNIDAEPLDSRDLNVLLITIDTCRADKLSCYGFSLPTSPRIDALAKEGFLFENAFSTSNWTRPATASLFTSVYPATHQTNMLVQRIPAALQCLPERFKRAGYRTAVFSANPNISPDFGFDQGVQFFFETSKQSMIWHSTLYNSLSKLSPSIGKRLKRFGHQTLVEEGTTEAEAICASFLTWLKKMEGKKFFAYLHFNAPHAPYDPPKNFDVFAENPAVFVDRAQPQNDTRLSESGLQRLLSLYYGEILLVDSIVGKITDALIKGDLLNKTIIVITADHGEEFYDHQGWGHSHSMYNELIHIPLIMYIPGSPFPPGRVESYVSLIDVGPTILFLVGLSSDDFMDGKNLIPLLRGDTTGVHDVIIAQNIQITRDNSIFAIIRDGLKYIQQGFKPKKNRFLYDLEEDFAEMNSLSLVSTPLGQELKNELGRMNLYTYQKRKDSHQVQLSDEKKEQLKALGYID